jgi:hypothetical protein
MGLALAALIVLVLGLLRQSRLAAFNAQPIAVRKRQKLYDMVLR